jgi:hypothetical protein
MHGKLYFWLFTHYFTIAKKKGLTKDRNTTKNC